eukprot:8372129-Lingulodinium_polyedra.AAC.1
MPVGEVAKLYTRLYLQSGSVLRNLPKDTHLAPQDCEPDWKYTCGHYMFDAEPRVAVKAIKHRRSLMAVNLPMNLVLAPGELENWVIEENWSLLNARIVNSVQGLTFSIKSMFQNAGMNVEQLPCANAVAATALVLQDDQPEEQQVEAKLAD